MDTMTYQPADRGETALGTPVDMLYPAAVPRPL